MNKNLCTIALLVCMNANAADMSLGVVTSYSPAVYKGLDSNIVPFPLIGYEGSQFFVRGTSLGWRLNKAGSPQNVIFRVIYDPRTLKPEDSDNEDIKKIEERESSFLAGVSYQLTTIAGIMELGAGSDIGNIHNGLYGQLSFRHPIYLVNGAMGVIPEIGYSYNSDKLNNHLYGVSKAEADKTSFEQFDANWSGEYFVALNGYMHLSQTIRVTGGIRYSNLDSHITDSPLLDRSVSISGTAGISYVF